MNPGERSDLRFFLNPKFECATRLISEEHAVVHGATMGTGYRVGIRFLHIVHFRFEGFLAIFTLTRNHSCSLDIIVGCCTSGQARFEYTLRKSFLAPTSMANTIAP